MLLVHIIWISGVCIQTCASIYVIRKEIERVKYIGWVMRALYVCIDLCGPEGFRPVTVCEVYRIGLCQTKLPDTIYFTPHSLIHFTCIQQGHRYSEQCVELVFLCSGELPEDDALVPKHVGVDFLQFVFYCIFLGAFVG